MQILRLDEATHLHYRDEGHPRGPALVFANSLGTDLRLWDAVLPHLPTGFRLVRCDKRGHGLSACPQGAVDIELLADDMARLMEHLEVSGAVFVGLSIGGMIGQLLAARRPDLVRAAVFSNTLARIGTPQMWNARIDAVRAGGVQAIADSVIERWFSRSYLNDDAALGWKTMLQRTPSEGYAACAEAVRDADLTEIAAGLDLPVLVIAGEHDGATPPGPVLDFAHSIPGARYREVAGAGHLPCVERPEHYALMLTEFLHEVGHV